MESGTAEGMIVATWVIAIAGIVTAVVAIVSAWFFKRGIEEQNKNSEKQVAAYKLALSVEVALKLDTSFNESHFKQLRSAAATALLDRKNQEEAEDVFDFFETVGLFVKLGVLNEEVAHNFFFHWINLYWKAGKHHIGSKQKETASTWKEFEKLYEKVCSIERECDSDSEDLKMPDDRLREQLRDEVDLTLSQNREKNNEIWS